MIANENMRHGACLLAVLLPILALILPQVVVAPSTLVIENVSFSVETCCVTVSGEVHNVGSMDSYETRVSAILYDHKGFAIWVASTSTWNPYIQAGSMDGFTIFVANAGIAQDTWDYQLMVSSQ